jgi:hypothetical protein
MRSLFDIIPAVVVFLAAGSAAFSAALSIAARRPSKLTNASNEREVGKERDYRVEIRLRQVQAILSHEIDRKGIFRLSAAALIFSQFVVGGMLASSFVAKTLGEGLIGLLGLIVLAASLISQHFRPDLLHKIAAQKVRRLRALKRKLEDDLYVATRGGITDTRLIEIRLYASNTLEEIETVEYESLRNEKEKV